MPRSAKATLRLLIQHEARAYFSLADLKAAMKQAGSSLGAASLRVYLSEAVKDGFVHDAGHGWYSRLETPVPLDSKPVRSLVRRVRATFPLLEFSCWSTAQINPWMHHLLAQPTAFLYAPVDALEDLAEALRGNKWDVVANPGAEAAKRVQPGGRAVVLRPSISKQPEGADHQAPIEKILVDLLVEAPRLSLMDEGEAVEAVRRVLGKYLVQISSFQSYAERRGVEIERVMPVNKVQSKP